MSDETTIKPSSSESERIYIGGLEPPRLTVRDLSKRLSSISQIQIESIDDGSKNDTTDTRTFMFVQASSKDSEKRSAFDIIASNYHNVKWKGCRIIVESARLTFLQRLEHERQEKAQNHPVPKSEVTETSCSITNVNRKIPRQLRIRRKYGEESFKVDTKPREMKDFTQFSRYLQYIRKAEQRQKQKQQQVKGKKNQEELGKKTVLKRSLHIKFSEDGYDCKKVPSLSSMNKNSNTASESDSDSDSDSTTSSSSDASSSTQNSKVPEVTDASDTEEVEDDDNEQVEYIWSDEDDNESQKNDEEGSTASNKRGNEMDGDHDEDKDSFVIQETNYKTNDSVKQKENISSAPKKSSYMWSDDESSDDETDDDIEEIPMAKFDDDEGSQKEEENDDDDDDKYNLSLDVASNLNILSQMFGNVNTKPNAVEFSGEQSDKPLSNNSSDGAKLTSVLNGNLPSMQRFDPTDTRSIQKFQKVTVNKKIEEEKETADVSSEDDREEDDYGEEDSEEKSGGECEEDGEEYSVEEESGEDTTPENIDDNKINNESATEEKGVVVKDDDDDDEDKNYIYKQSKLETIFQKARENPQVSEFKFGSLFGGVMSNETEENNKNKSDSDNAGGGFSFGFQMSDETTTQENSMETNNANIESIDKQCDENEEKANDSTITTHSRATDTTTTSSMYGFDIPRHQGLEYYKQSSNDFLNKWVNHFYDIYSNQITNCDNERKAHNHDSKDEQQEEQDIWIKERKTLTMDWKRKQKLALSRKSKKRRHH